MKLVVGLQTERRAGRRDELAIDGTVTTRADRAATVMIEELSTSGFLMLAVVGFELGDEVRINLPGAGEHPAKIVRKERLRFGCAFAAPLSEDQRLAVMTTFLKADDARHHRMLSGWRPGGEAFAA